VAVANRQLMIWRKRRHTPRVTSQPRHGFPVTMNGDIDKHVGRRNLPVRYGNVPDMLERNRSPHSGVFVPLLRFHLNVLPQDGQIGDQEVELAALERDEVGRGDGPDGPRADTVV